MELTISLANEATKIGLPLTAEQLSQLNDYSNRLANAEINLTSTRDREQVEGRHLVESLAYGRLLDQQGLLPDGARVLDLGSGGGLPGIPIKIAWPGIKLTLLESVGKKCRFLEQVACELHLEDVSVIEGRAEALGRDETQRAQYDLVLARAVASLPVLIEYSLPFLRVGGWLAAVKGSAALEEIDSAAAALSEIGGRVCDTPSFDSPHGSRQTVVIVEKTQPTPDRYPRRVGIPTKRPIL